MISNAFEHSPQGGCIKIEVFQELSDNSLLHFDIWNSGKGLTEEQIKEIFDKYKIFDQSKFGGLQVRSGIGLNLVKRLIEYLGGTITVTSEVGKYVEFSVVIPPLDVEGHNVIRLDPERNELPMADMEYKPKKHAETTIYVVEDNKSLRNLLLTILSDYTAVELNSDVETLEAIKHNYPDLIILDMMNNGLALVDSLKSDPKINYIPIIGISGDTSVEEEIEAYNHGVDVYMVKPFYPRQILSGIENLLTRQTLLKDYFNSSFSSLKIKNGIVLHKEDEALIEKVTD